MLRTTFLHSGWEFIQTDHIDQKVGFSKSEWLPAQVPGHVHQDLADNGVIGHPFERLNELGAQWVDGQEWSYRTTFEWSPDPALPRRVLRFEGLDTICTVFLNGETVAESDNMFIPVEVDVTDRLKAGTNEVRIDFRSAVKVGLERQEAYFAKEGLDTEKVGRFGERAFVRKAQYMYGWDWGPRLCGCGVWRPVKLVEFAARLTDVHVHQEHRADGIVVLTIKSEVEGEGVLVHSIEGAGARVGDGQFVLHEPPLWDPTDPELLRLVSAILPTGYDTTPFEVDLDEIEDDLEREVVEATGRALLSMDGLDIREQNIGIKTCELVRENDEFGQSFEFIVNGQRLWMRGANWIPDHSFPGVIDRTRLRDRLEKCVDMGFNMLRVWGGGLYETDEFYDLCDELGILVWQDFPFACGFYPDTDEYVEPFRQEAIANVRRIRNHPSLALWCGNNENHQCFADRWAGDKTPPRFYGEHFYHGVIPEVLAEFDPGRSYTPGSACGPTEAPLTQVNQGGFGDSHYWDVWHGRGDWRFYADSTARFSSEFGFCSSPSLACWETVLDDEDWSVYSPAVRWHDKTGKGYDTFVGFVKLHYPEPKTLEDWAYYSQLNQRDALRFGIEHFRRSEFCRGTLVWQINDCWPVQSWAMMDSLGNYKALGYESRRIYADTLVSLRRDEERVEVWVINDEDGAYEESPLLVTAYSTIDGTILKTWDAEVDVDADDRVLALTVDITGLNVNETILVAEFGDATAWQLLGEPKNTRFGAPAPILASTAGDGSITLKVDGPVVDLMLLDDGSPAPFRDNYLTLPTGGTVEVRVNAIPDSIEARSLAGVHPIRVTRSPI